MKRLILIASAALLLSSQSPPPLLPGSPLPGISPADFERFRIGLDDFLEVETAEEGLGPAFNGRSCAECHSAPAVGGIALIAETRAGHVDEDGKFTALDGETLRHLFSVPPHRCQVQIPPEANVVARRVPIPLFGAGLVEAIPDEAIVALEDPGDANGDSISGRAARITDRASGRPRIGRFGWKAQHATLLVFGADAYRNEMGITNELFREEVAAGVDPEQLRLCDARRDPEDRRDPRTGLRGIDNFESFMKFLAPIGRAAADPEAARGESLFRSAGCASCHVPVLITGPDAHPLFDRRAVPLFSDLLLHDVGTGDGIEQEAAQADEIRTPALWGLRLRRPLLHDGSAATPDAAIRRHAGEAEKVRERYEALSEAERNALLGFLAIL
ncbi:MAG: di-heme oxidoredictase family protein [Bryobacteraceae bacterium]